MSSPVPLRHRDNLRKPDLTRTISTISGDSHFFAAIDHSHTPKIKHGAKGKSSTNRAIANSADVGVALISRKTPIAKAATPIPATAERREVSIKAIPATAACRWPMRLFSSGNSASSGAKAYLNAVASRLQGINQANIEEIEIRVDGSETDFSAEMRTKTNGASKKTSSHTRMKAHPFGLSFGMPLPRLTR